MSAAANPEDFIAIRSDRAGPCTLGLEICSPLEEKPYPMISPKILAPRLFAELKLSTITVADPPLGTRPSLFLSNGRDAAVGLFSRIENAPSASKLPIENLLVSWAPP